jgi:hypothetical protein
MSEENNKLFTLTNGSGDARDVFPNDLDDNTRPLANEVSMAMQLQNARQAKYNEALVEVRTNEIINAFISERASALEKALPPVVKVATKSGEVKKDKS